MDSQRTTDNSQVMQGADQPQVVFKLSILAFKQFSSPENRSGDIGD